MADEFVDGLREDLKEAWKSVALITIHTPERVTNEDAGRITDWFRNQLDGVSAAPVVICDAGSTVSLHIPEIVKAMVGSLTPNELRQLVGLEEKP